MSNLSLHVVWLISVQDKSGYFYVILVLHIIDKKLISIKVKKSFKNYNFYFKSKVLTLSFY